MGLKGKIFKFLSDILNDGSYYKLYTQAKSTSACGLPKGFFLLFNVMPMFLLLEEWGLLNRNSVFVLHVSSFGRVRSSE